ncbi:hypothetical protein HMPREF9946_03601 [Acetobacteraceae bacterium AT-5844]|nr:hypothetical protein HMPREF9946_03601 [Acetobacteraceae bacterium AT-5844]
MSTLCQRLTTFAWIRERRQLIVGIEAVVASTTLDVASVEQITKPSV